MSRVRAGRARGDAEGVEWDDARYVLAIHRAGSLSAAARALDVNQSTVGRRLEALEAALAARLFFRTREGYVVTPEGERLLPHAVRMEEEAHAIRREISGQEARLTGLVRLTAPEAMSAKLLLPILGRFHARYPSIQLQLVADNRSLNLTKREADIAVRVGKPTDPQLIARRVCAFGAAPYASKTYIAAHGLPVAPRFEGHDAIGYVVSLGRVTEERWIAERFPDARIAFHSNSTPAQVGAAVAGMGIALLPCYLGDEEPTLVRLGTDADMVMRALWLVVHRDLREATRIRVCCDFLVDGLGPHLLALSGKRGRDAE